MPANLPPQYHKAEEEYRRAQTPLERVEALETMFKLVPKHKGTEKLQADLKSRLKEARAEQKTEKKAGKKGPSYKFPRQGAGQLILVGAPNAGRSRLLAELTRAEPEVAPYPFTTQQPLPGMMPWRDVAVQLIDTPPIVAGHVEPYMVNLVRAADGVLLCMDGNSDEAPDATAEVLQELETRKTALSDRTGFDEDDFTVVRVRTLLVVTRGSDPECEDRLEYFRELTGHSFPVQWVEFDDEESREALREAIYNFLGVIRVYTKSPGKPADYDSPFTIPAGGTVEDLAAQVHRELAETCKSARVWGGSAHEGQTVGRDHVLRDDDLVEIHGA